MEPWIRIEISNLDRNHERMIMNNMDVDIEKTYMEKNRYVNIIFTSQIHLNTQRLSFCKDINFYIERVRKLVGLGKL